MGLVPIMSSWAEGSTTPNPLSEDLSRKGRGNPMPDLPPELVTVLVDTREKRPFSMGAMPTEPGSLATGDYVLKAAPNFAVVERKSIGDLAGCLGSGRERFEKELQRLRAFSRRITVVECSYPDLLNYHRTEISPASIAGSIASWSGKYCGFLFAGNRVDAADFVQRFLFLAAKTLWDMGENFRKELRNMKSAMKDTGGAQPPGDFPTAKRKEFQNG